MTTTFNEFDLFASGFLGSDAAFLRVGGFGALADDSIPVGFDLQAFTTRAISYSFETREQGGFGVTAMVHSYDMRLIPGGGAMATVVIGGLWFGGRRRHAPGRARRSIQPWDTFVTHTHRHFRESAFVGLGGLTALSIAAPTLGQYVDCGPARVETLALREMPQNLDRLGESIAIVGDLVVAGAPGRNGDRGGASVFAWDGFEWIESSVIDHPNPQPQDAFGDSIAAAGDVVVVGAPL